MEELRLLTDEELERAYKEVFREAFPPEELKSLAAIRRMRDGGYYDTYALCRDGRPSAFCFNWRDEGYVLIDYLCVDRALRNGGLGSKTLELMMKKYPADTVFIGEVEAPDGGDEDAIKLRRLEFYRRSGAVTAGYDSAIFGVHYKTIVWSRGAVDEAEVMRRHDGLYRRGLPPEVYSRAVQIPLRPGEKPHDRQPWVERPGET